MLASQYAAQHTDNDTSLDEQHRRLRTLSIAASMEGAPAEAKFITVVVVVMLTSVLSGLLFVLIGGFKLSRLVRFIPYPVVGGFVAGTGLLLAEGAVGGLA